MNPDGLPERLQARLARGRAAAEARMLSRCTIRRDVGLAPQDPETGRQPREWETIHANLPCRLGTGTGAHGSRTLPTPGGDIEVPTRDWNVPHGTTNLQPGDLIEITAGDSVGQVLELVSADAADQTTALRLPVIGAHRPEEW